MVSLIVTIAASLCTAAAIVIFVRAVRTPIPQGDAETHDDPSESGDESDPTFDSRGRRVNLAQVARFESALPAPPAERPRLRKFAE